MSKLAFRAQAVDIAYLPLRRDWQTRKKRFVKEIEHFWEKSA